MKNPLREDKDAINACVGSNGACFSMEAAMSEVSATSVSMPTMVPPAPAAATPSPAVAAAAATNAKPQPPSEAAKQAPFRVDPQRMRQELQDIASQLNQQVQRTGTALGFAVDEVAGRQVVTVLNKESGEVVRQIPGDEVLAVAHNIERLKGIIFSRNA